MLFPEPLTPKPHFNICVSSEGKGKTILKGEEGSVWAEGERVHSDLRTNKTAAVAASQKVDNGVDYLPKQAPSAHFPIR